MKLLLVGHGKMGAAMLSGWQTADLLTEAYVVDPALDGSFTNGSVCYVATAVAVPANFTPDIIVFAVKPQIFEAVAVDYQILASESGAVLLSIMAGKTIDSVDQQFKNAAIIRTMPNLPATISQGMTALIANEHVSQHQKHMAQQLLEAVGDVLWVEKESHLDAITAISGSGPAYMFYFIESFMNAAKTLGFEEEAAKKLVYQTIEGSMLLAKSSDQAASELRVAVTSKGGTTEAALNVLTPQLERLMCDAVEAAKIRSEELA